MVTYFIEEWEETQRPASAAGSYSSPIGLGFEAGGIRSSTRSTKSELQSKELKTHKKKQTFAEVGIRSIGDQIHSVYKGISKRMHLSYSFHL